MIGLYLKRKSRCDSQDRQSAALYRVSASSQYCFWPSGDIRPVAMRCQFNQVCQMDLGGTKAKPLVSSGGWLEEEGAVVGEASAIARELARRLRLSHGGGAACSATYVDTPVRNLD